MTETVQDATRLFAITCESDGKCRSVFDQGRDTYRGAWQAAYDEGWRCDLSGVRHCPSCVAERQPVITLWLDGQALTGYLATKAARPDDLTQQTVITGVRRLPATMLQPVRLDCLDDEPAEAQPAHVRGATLPAPPGPDLGEAREKALANWTALHDAEDAREAGTTTMPAADGGTSLIPAADDEGGNT